VTLGETDEETKEMADFAAGKKIKGELTTREISEIPRVGEPSSLLEGKRRGE